MRIKTIHIENFKGLREFTLDIDGKDTNIYGANETSKTTILDGFLWVWTGKDSEDRPDYDILPKDPITKCVIPGLNPEVEAVWDNGLTLKRLYREVRSKEGKVTGHTTDYWIGENGAGLDSKKDKQYHDYLKTIVDPEAFKVLTNVFYFNYVLPWDRRRKILMQSAGQDPAKIDRLEKIRDQAKTNLSTFRGQYIKEKNGGWLSKISIQIDEATRALPEIPALSPGNLNELRPKLKELQQKKASATSNSAVADIRQKITQVDTELLQIKNQQGEKIQGQIRSAQGQLDDGKRLTNIIEDEISAKRRESTRILEEVKSLEESNKTINEQGKALSSQVWSGNVDCPTCKQHLPTDQVEEAKVTFNLQKSTELEKKREQFKVTAARIKELKSQDTVITQEINALNNQLPALQTKAKEYQATISDLQGMLKSIESLPEYLAILERRNALNNALQNALQSTTVDTSGIDKEITEITAEIERSEKVAVIIKQREQGLARIEELKAEEKKLAAKTEDAEREYSKAKDELNSMVSGLEGDINAQFEYVQYRMFSPILKGDNEWQAVCEVTDKKGVKALSNSQKIKAGADVRNVLAAKLYGIDLPFFADNKESCTLLPYMGDTQIISLYVSPADKVLRVELVNKKEVS